METLHASGGAKPLPPAWSTQVRQAATERGRYYETPDGRFPSVTNVLGIVSKPALLNWMAKVEREYVIEAAADLYLSVGAVPEKMSKASYVAALSQALGRVKAGEKLKQKAADIGTQAHQMIEWHLRTELKQEPGPCPEIGPEAAIAFAAYQEWRQSPEMAHVRPLRIEQVVWHAQDRHAGTLDIMAMDGDALELWDFKTSAAVYREYQMQMEAYAESVEHMGHGRSVRNRCVRLPKRSGDKLEVVTWERDPGAYQAFLCALGLWCWVNGEAT